MTEIIETPDVVAVASLDVAKDEESGDDYALLSLHLQNDKIVRLPMPVEVAMRVWAVLDRARQDKGWPEPSMPVSTDTMQ